MDEGDSTTTSLLLQQPGMNEDEEHTVKELDEYGEDKPWYQALTDAFRNFAMTLAAIPGHCYHSGRHVHYGEAPDNPDLKEHLPESSRSMDFRGALCGALEAASATIIYTPGELDLRVPYFLVIANTLLVVGLCWTIAAKDARGTVELISDTNKSYVFLTVGLIGIPIATASVFLSTAQPLLRSLLLIGSLVIAGVCMYFNSRYARKGRVKADMLTEDWDRRRRYRVLRLWLCLAVTAVPGLVTIVVGEYEGVNLVNSQWFGGTGVFAKQCGYALPADMPRMQRESAMAITGAWALAWIIVQFDVFGRLWQCWRGGSAETLIPYQNLEIYTDAVFAVAILGVATEVVRDFLISALSDEGDGVGPLIIDSLMCAYFTGLLARANHMTLAHAARSRHLSKGANREVLFWSNHCIATVILAPPFFSFFGNHWQRVPCGVRAASLWITLAASFQLALRLLVRTYVKNAQEGKPTGHWGPFFCLRRDAFYDYYVLEALGLPLVATLACGASEWLNHSFPDKRNKLWPAILIIAFVHVWSWAIKRSFKKKAVPDTEAMGQGASETKEPETQTIDLI